jgi:hypothetical protein
VTEPDLSEAVVCYLRRYPGRNDEEFHALVPTQAGRDAVQAVLEEAHRVDVDWHHASLVEIGERVRDGMRQRRPELSEAALRALGNHVTYSAR